MGSTSVMRTCAAHSKATGAGRHKFVTLGPLGVLPEEEDDGKSLIDEPHSAEAISRDAICFSDLPERCVKVYQIKPVTCLESLRSSFVPIPCQVMLEGKDGTTVEESSIAQFLAEQYKARSKKECKPI